MFKDFKGMRYWFIQSYFMTAVLSSLIFFVGLQLYIFLFTSTNISILNVFVLTGFIFLINLLLGGYFGLRASYLLRGRLSDMFAFVSTLRRGKLSERIHIFEKDEIGNISEELNSLASYIEDQVRSLQRLADEKTTLAQSAHAAAVMEERQRLARDLHDVVSQQLFALSMMCSAALRLMEKNPQKAKLQLEEIAEIAGKAQGEMRALLLHLRPIHLSNDSLCEGIVKLIQELKQKTNITFQASIDEINDLSKGIEEHLFRIVQEALSNILRHAEASKIKIQLSEKEKYIYLYIEDNGRGFDPTKEKITSYGLQTMRERCEEMGGIFEIRSKEEEGTYIDIRIPKKGRNEV